MSDRWHHYRTQLAPLLGLRPWRRHSLVLAVGGAVYLLIGLSYIVTPTTSTRATALEVPLSIAGLDVWGALWIVVGLLTFASTRWPPASETWGYTAMSSLSALWAAFYAAAMCLGAPLSTISAVLVWALFAFMWWAVSGLRNPEDLLPPEAPTIEGE